MVSWEQCAFVPPSNRYLGGRSGGEKRRMETFNYDSVLAVSPLIYLELKKKSPSPANPPPPFHRCGKRSSSSEIMGKEQTSGPFSQAHLKAAPSRGGDLEAQPYSVWVKSWCRKPKKLRGLGVHCSLETLYYFLCTLSTCHDRWFFPRSTTGHPLQVTF